jgi:NADPH:quinone reductase-like Zn-dependent oxidoreductase
MPIMKAILIESFGGPEVLRCAEVAEPRLRPDQVLIAVRAAAINPRDVLIRAGRYVFRRFLPKLPFILGSDLAGEILEIGSEVRGFAVGDEVMAMVPTSDGFGAYAERAAVRASVVVHKPRHFSFLEAAAVPLAGLTALQALRDNGRLVAGQRVVIVGASGGVGGFAVQVAKSLGAEVVAVCSAANHGLVKELGANLALDYRDPGFREQTGACDVVFDVFGKERPADWRFQLRPRATFVTTVPKAVTIRAALLSLLPWQRPRVRIALVRSSGKDLEILSAWATAGRLRVEIDQVRPLESVAELHEHQSRWHSRGKNVLEIG